MYFTSVEVVGCVIAAHWIERTIAPGSKGPECSGSARFAVTATAPALRADGEGILPP
jgi:hypothetical protein